MAQCDVQLVIGALHKGGRLESVVEPLLSTAGNFTFEPGSRDVTFYKQDFFVEIDLGIHNRRTFR